MLPPHPCWPVLFLIRREVGYLRRLAGPASLEDWRCSYLCSELIPYVTEKSSLFVKELPFPQTAPIDDAFFNRIGLESVGVVRPELGMLLGWSAASNVALFCKNKKEEGSAGASPVAPLCLSQFLPERKDRLLRGRMFLRTFHRWGGLVYIVYVFPNWMVIRILSHWMGYFLPLSLSD